jgi:transposase InsO family protein
MYTTKHSRNAADFIQRLAYLLDYELWNTCHDNGSEFAKEFQEAIETLGLGDYWSRPATPKDNPVNERFNRTIQEEFVNLGNMTDDVIRFNHMVTEWLVEYNFVRPHQTLRYKTPWSFYQETAKVLPMYSSSTRS